MLVSFAEKENKSRRRTKWKDFFLQEFWNLLGTQSTGQACIGDRKST